MPQVAKMHDPDPVDFDDEHAIAATHHAIHVIMVGAYVVNMHILEFLINRIEINLLAVAFLVFEALAEHVFFEIADDYSLRVVAMQMAFQNDVRLHLVPAIGVEGMWIDHQARALAGLNLKEGLA